MAKKWKNNGSVILDETGLIGIAYINTKERYIGTKESEANAKLMAASPDMLEALQNLENDDNSIPEHAWKLVVAARIKAVG